MTSNSSAPNNWESLLTQQERKAYSDFFKKVDEENKGIVLKDEAMAFFQKSNIPLNIIQQFWDISDNDKKGFLIEQEFSTVLKFIACAQHEVMPGDPILATSVGLPHFNSDGYSGSTQQQQQQQQQQQKSVPPPLPTNRPLGGTTPDLVSPDDRAKYISLFQSFGAENNILSGEKARDSFLRSRLPSETLQHIWTLADTRQSGSLNQTEFIIAMHYIERCMKGLSPLPPSLPPAVYASATGRSMHASPLLRHNTIATTTPQRLPTSPVFKGAPMPQQANAFDISPEEYNKYKNFFNQLNVNSGFVSGADAVVFFKHSKLNDSDLARIWDLADTNSSGYLNEQEFAFAMHLINRKVAGGEIPTTAPQMKIGGASLLAPPGQQQQQQQQQHQYQQQQPIADLLGLSSDTTDAPAPTSPQQPQQSHFNNTDFASTQSALQSSIQQETTRNQLAQSQYHNESQTVQELERQIASQKETLEKIKQEAEEAEKQLASEKEKKEKLTKELRMYRQEIKHFSTRAENAQEETKQVKKEIEELEKSQKAAVSSPLQTATSPIFNNNNNTNTSSNLSPTTSHNDFFTLSSSTPSLFAKVEDSNAAPTPASPPQATSPSSSSQKVFDPFAGFKVHQANVGSPTPSATSLNHLKEESEKKKTVGSPNVDISDIESKFPDLSTMEQNFPMPTSPSLSTTSQKKPELVSSPKSTVSASAVGKNEATESLFKPSKDNIFGLVDKPKTTDAFPEKSATTSKYGFDLSAFEPSTSTQSGNNMSVKDELSSLFGGSQTEEKPASNFSDAFSTSIANNDKPAPNFSDAFSTSTANNDKPASDGFDDIFGTPAATNKPNSFEDIFFQK